MSVSSLPPFYDVNNNIRTDANTTNFYDFNNFTLTFINPLMQKQYESFRSSNFNFRLAYVCLTFNVIVSPMFFYVLVHWNEFSFVWIIASVIELMNGILMAVVILIRYRMESSLNLDQWMRISVAIEDFLMTLSQISTASSFYARTVSGNRVIRLFLFVCSVIDTSSIRTMSRLWPLRFLQSQFSWCHFVWYYRLFGLSDFASNFMQGI